MKGIIFDIQHYAIYDGPGIRTTIFFKGCPLSCVWCHNPESQSLKPQISFFAEKCAGCGKCIEVCPNDAIYLKNGKIVRNQKLCKACAKCADACPNNVLSLVGKSLSVEELVDIAIQDKPFYDNSGGGVTISGGEPTMQLNFLLELLGELKNQKIHTAIETCGYFNDEFVNKLISFVDLFLFDIKHIDSDIHQKYTSVPNQKILSNFTSILSKVGSKRIIPRIPLIPGVNTNKATINQIAEFLKSAGYSGLIHLMPYNKLAKTKYEKIGKGKYYQDMGALSDLDIKQIGDCLEAKSFSVTINH